MLFYGLQKNSLIDYPGEISCILFTFGCNFRCPYCHNPELINGKEKLKSYTADQIFDFLNTRKNLLTGVCITGGEPLLNEEIIGISEEIRKLGFKLKIDTNGSMPDILKKIKADYIAMDIKTSFEKYSLVGCADKDGITDSIKESIAWIIKSGIAHEFRTTVVPYIVDKDDIKKIASAVKGASKYAIAQFRPDITLDPEWGGIEPYPFIMLDEMKAIIKEAGIPCEIRGKR